MDSYLDQQRGHSLAASSSLKRKRPSQSDVWEPCSARATKRACLKPDEESFPPTLDFQSSIDAFMLLGSQVDSIATVSSSFSPDDCWTGSGEEFRDRFKLTGRALGSGQFGSVSECVDRLTGERLACKTMKKPGYQDSPGLSSTEVQDVQREAAIMSKVLGHAGVIQLHGLYESEEEINLVMELCEGGDLFDEILRRSRFSEPAAADVFSQLVSAVSFCHSQGIFHRDLKPENVLLTKRDGPGERLTVKLADFGLALELKEGQKLVGLAGSPYYMAPEVISGEYDKQADLWSLGVILYILLSGSPPFWSETDEGVFQAIRRGHVDMSCEPWGSVSSLAKDLVSKLLSRNPADRPCFDDIMAHPWLQVNCNFDCCANMAASSLVSLMLTRAFGSVVV